MVETAIIGRKARSPSQLAQERFLRRPWVRPSLWLLATLALLGIYAPALVGDAALVWKDATGWHFPVLGELFNAWAFSKQHDVLFNLLALALPFLALGWVFLSRWSRVRRLVIFGALVIAGWVALCWLPIGTTVDGDAQTFWRRKAQSEHTIAHWRELDAQQQAPFAIFPLIPHDFDATFAGQAFKTVGSLNPDTGSRFWLGTDSAGRDVLSLILYGIRISLTVGLVATGLSMLIGLIIGGISGYFGGWVDLVLQRVVEVMMCFPTFILIVIVVAMLDRNIFVIMTVIGLTGWAGTARLVRGEFLAQSVRDYVAAAEALGLPRWRIMFRHILPNTLTPLIISATFGVAGAVGSESGLSFIGLGDPTAPSWGVLMEQGRQNIRYGWLIWSPGLAVFAFIIVLNVIGSGLREALDPRQADG